MRTNFRCCWKIREPKKTPGLPMTQVQRMQQQDKQEPKKPEQKMQLMHLRMTMGRLGWCFARSSYMGRQTHLMFW